MKRLVPMLIVALAVAGCSRSAPERNAASGDAPHAAAGQPVVQLPVLPGRPGAAYFTVEVSADHGALVGVSSPQAGRIEMHETMRQGAMSGMRPLARIVPENGRIVLARGGPHLMLFDVDAALAPGASARLILRFEGGQTRPLDARVVAAGGEHDGH